MEKEINLHPLHVSQYTTTNKIDSPDPNCTSSIYNLQLMNLLEDELKEIYWSEKALSKSISKMIKRATSNVLIEILETYLEQKKEHIKRVEDAFELIEKGPSEKKCKAIATLIEEADLMLAACDVDIICDMEIISAGQKVEHYEIGIYTTLRKFVQNLGLTHVASILDKTLQEEIVTDQKLAKVAACI